MVSSIKLPQCEIFYSDAFPEFELLFVAGGRFPCAEWFREVSAGRKIFCVDRGVELCRKCDIVPEILLGDFDSASELSVEWAANKKILIDRHPIDKDFTDTQLALNRAFEIFGEYFAVITGAFGGRFDHLYSNVFTCANSPRKICLADEREIIFYVRGGEKVTVDFFTRPIALSLLPITNSCEGVTTKNLHWELDGATLTQIFPNAISNRVEGGEVQLAVERGNLACHITFAEDTARQ